MVRKPILLSALAMLISLINTAAADSFLLPVKSSVCVDVTAGKSRSDIRFEAYDKAAFVAVKSSTYMKQKANTLEDHSYDVFAYRLADSALNDISLITVRDDDEKICLELSGVLDTKQADEIFLNRDAASIKPDSVSKIAHEVNSLLPKSLYETDSMIPLVYIKDIEFFNNTASSAYTAKIAQQLSFEPRVLVTENKELADYYIVPKLLLSKSEKIDEKHSRFSMSVAVELQKINGIVVDKEEQNRYIIISDEENTQEIAQKLLVKLLEESISAMSRQLNSLLQY